MDAAAERAVASLLEGEEEAAPPPAARAAAPAEAPNPEAPNPMVAVAQAMLDNQPRPKFSDFASVPAENPFEKSL